VERSTIGDVIRRGAQLFGDRTALVSDGRRHSYAELDETSTRLADALLTAGAAPGDRVATLMFNDAAHVVVFLAAAKARLVIVPVNRRLTASEVASVLASARPAVLLHDAALESVARAGTADPTVRLVRVGGDPAQGCSFETLVGKGFSTPPSVSVSGADTQAIYYTSGTTGTPKGVVRSHQSNMYMAWGYLAMMPVRPDDSVFYAFPLTSAAFYGLTVPAWMQGAKVVMHREFDAARLIRDLCAEQVTHTALAPTMWEMLMADPTHRDHPPTSLRYALWGGSPIRAGTLARLAEWLPVPAGGVYGLTEATCVTACVGEDLVAAPSSCGRPTAGSMVRVVDSDRRPVPAGELGEVEICSLVCADGYYGNPDLTAEVFVDGWFRTGDFGCLDTDGRLSIVDRVKDLIISGGENIYPGEIENAVTGLSGVQEVCALGVPDEKWGETVCVFIAPRPGAEVTVDAVLDACRDRLAGYKRPRYVEFLPTLPKNSMGKFVKASLLDEWRSRLRGAAR
jgi:acyl-CoA synthetase (AMP-forming)/AMP-acid ligase II